MSCFPLTPATARIATMMTARTITVPRSGWSSTSPMGTLTSPMITVRRQASISPR